MRISLQPPQPMATSRESPTKTTSFTGYRLLLIVSYHERHLSVRKRETVAAFWIYLDMYPNSIVSTLLCLQSLKSLLCCHRSVNMEFTTTKVKKKLKFATNLHSPDVFSNSWVYFPLMPTWPYFLWEEILKSHPPCNVSCLHLRGVWNYILSMVHSTLV